MKKQNFSVCENIDKMKQAFFDFEESIDAAQTDFPQKAFEEVSARLAEYLDNPIERNRQALSFAVTLLSAKFSAWELEEIIRSI